MRIPAKILTVSALLSTFVSGSALGATLVNDTWQDSTRTDPASPIYAENTGIAGVDADLDGNFESVWFKGGAGTLTAAPNDLQGAGFGGSSASWYTYFTPAATPVTLALPGDQLKLTWTFVPRGVNANNTSQGFNVALASTPAASRVAADASVPSANYLGYAMFMNMGNTLGNANPFQLRKWANPGTGGALLGTGANWTSVGNGATSGNTGYASDTEYTFVMTLTRNASSGLDVTATMTGGNLNNAGSATISYSDTTASQGFSFDTFDIRPTSNVTTANTFDTELFRVEFANVPEPSAFGIMVVGGLLTFRCRRKSR